MGAWGPAIFSDDLASDIRADFRDLIGEGLTPQEATARILQEYADATEDVDDAPVFWMALAATQWKLGRLVPEVRDKAIRAIDDGADLHLWRDTPDLKKRQAAEQKLKQQLLSPAPPARKVPKAWQQDSPLQVGEYFLYTHRSGRQLLFRTIDIFRDKGGSYPVVELLDWEGDKKPSERQLKKLKPRKDPLPNALTGRERPLTLILTKYGKRDDPSSKIESLAVIKRSYARNTGGTIVSWKFLDGHLEKTGVLPLA